MKTNVKNKTLVQSIAGVGLLVTVITGLTLTSNKVDGNPVDPNLPVVTVYKSASCGCCRKWVDRLRENGFQVEAHDVGNLYPYKQKAQIGPGMGSCHTAFVDGYAIEGHVPAADIKRLLVEKPAISGLTVPAMPIGTPGMEVPGRAADAYQVISFKEGQQVGVFSNYPAEK